MPFNLRQSVPVILLLIGGFALHSCKENSILPKDLVPAIDNINTFDTTLNLVTHTLYQDSFPTGGRRGDLRLSATNTFYSPCGVINADPVFGNTIASMHVEVLPPTPNFSFKAPADSIIADSVILSIPFKSSYGDTVSGLAQQRFFLYRSLKTFPRDSTQYEFTRDSIQTDQLLSSLWVNFATLSVDSPVVGGQKQQPQLRFKVSTSFMDSLKAQVKLGSNGATSTFDAFLKWWQGFAIVPANNKGMTLGYFETFRTKLTLYYRYPQSGGTLVSANDVFSFDPNYCNRFSTITSNYEGSSSKPYIRTYKPGGDSLLFVQNEPGLCGLIHLPGLANFPNVIVNRAELVFTVFPGQQWIDTLNFKIVPRLQIFRCDSSGSNDKVAEDYVAFGSANYVDGRRSTQVVNGQTLIQYKFIVSNSIQRLISQKDSTFRYKIMGVNNGFPAAYRAILSGSGSQVPAWQPKLNMIYTRLK